MKWKIGLDVGSQPWRVEATVEADGWSHVEGPKPMELMVVELDSQVLGAVGQEPAFLGVAAHEVREAQHPDVVVHEVHEKRRPGPLSDHPAFAVVGDCGEVEAACGGAAGGERWMWKVADEKWMVEEAVGQLEKPLTKWAVDDEA